MKNRLEGIVIEVKDKIAMVKIRRHGDCSGCGACPGDEAIVYEALNRAQAQLGKRVIVELESDHLVESVFIVFILPLLAVTLGCFGGVLLAGWLHQSPLLWEIAGGLTGLILSLGYVRYFEQSVKAQQHLPTIVQVAN